MTAAGADRWRLHRGGIVNIWQYDEQEFDFSGGRGVFQGTNGSGKSRTLELLLPLCLDGDLRQLGSKGFDTVSIRRLMLDDYDGGPNRIGYAWVELRKLGADGREKYLTCGLGLKASAASQQVSDSWRFVTEARVGVDLRLAGADRVPLGQAQLREEIGADCVLEDAAFRARIAEVVYGMPASRYGDLLHLQRTLRNPDVGLKVLEGQLEQILSDALPPLDASMIEQLATSFEDLESIRENIGRLSTADTALSAFLSSYNGYALSSLRAAGERAQSASNALRSERNETSKLTKRREEQSLAHAAAVSTVEELEARGEELDRAIDSLKELPAYQGLRDLTDRERLVAAARTAAGNSVDAASKHRTHADRAVDTVLTVLRRLGQDTEAASELISVTRQRLSAAGLDPALCPQVPAAPPAEAGVLTELVRAKPDPEAAPVEVQRRVPPEVHPEAYEAELRASAKRAEQATQIASQRAALTLSLHARAVDADKQRQSLEGLRQAARTAQLEATESAGRRNEAGQRLEDAAATWWEKARGWVGSGPFAESGARPPEPPSLEELRADADVARAAQEAARAWAAPRLQELRQAVLGATHRTEEIAARIADAEAELIALRGGVDSVPPRPAYARVDRDASQGAPFYRLVDFAPGLDDAERAGLEAALQASGLLAAWVLADGRDGVVADPEVAELLAAPADPAKGRTLADVLVAAVEPGCPVPTEVVERVLRAVGLLDGAFSAGLAVSTSGQWQAGVLSGALTKQAAEFVGAGARQAARQRRIAELGAHIETLDTERGAADEELAVQADRVSTLERHLEAFPDDRGLIAAHATLATAVRTASEATEKAARLRAEQSSADDRHQAGQAELMQTAAEAGLPADTETLHQANQAAVAARGSAEQLRDTLIGRCVRTVADLADALHDHQAAVDDLEDAARAADERCAEFAREASALTDLTTAIGGDAEQIAGQLTELEEQRRGLRTELPAARTAATELSNQVVKTETLLEGKETTIEAKIEAANNAEGAFRAALAAPGVWAAAFAEPTPVPDDVSEAIALLGSIEKRAVSEEVVITKLQALQTALAGTNEITPQRHGGVLTIVVAGEQGPRPVAEAAREVATQLAEQRGYLGERYQDIFAAFMLRDLAERLHGQISVAEDLARRMNEVLDVARSSQGVHVQLEWQPSAALDETILEALKLLRMPFAKRTEEQDEMLRRAFTERIDAERDSHSGGYPEILTRALDYRSWYTFTVRVRDSGPDGKPRTRRMRQLSSGETRLVSYVTLFAAAAAFYGAVSGATPDAEGPLRLVLLDEAFERLDDPTIARMLGLLVDLDMDWIITWPSGWGVSEKIPRMHIYDVLRPKSGRGVACTHTTWDGAALAQSDG
ncbi:MAG TPA: TIGR02680 family protein [Pseudonocardiaceae bacterium]|nr:TIGR02680 family protein [Pseudonocardiaceae bacterium]